MNNNVRTIAVAVAAAVVAVKTYSLISGFLEQRHLITSQRLDMRKSVAESTVGVNDLLELELEPSSITFSELFKRSDDRLKKLSDATIPVGTSLLPENEKKSLKSYLEGLEELLRLQTATYRKALALSSAADTVKDARADLVASSEYSVGYTSKRLTSALENAKKALSDYKAAKRDFAAGLQSFKKSLASIYADLADYNLLDDVLLGSLISKSTKNIKE